MPFSSVEELSSINEDLSATFSLSKSGVLCNVQDNLLNTRRYSNAALERKESTDACQISAVDGCRDTKDHEQKIQAAAKGTKIR